MKLGFIKPNYPNEKRVALMPDDIKDFKNNIIIEKGFGAFMDIKDSAYEDVGCSIYDRKKVYAESDAIFSLKLIQPSDYDYIKEGQIIVGWTHPLDSGKEFMEKQGIPKKLVIVDLDNISPKVFYKDKSISIDWIPKNFIYKNSFYAGYSAAMHGFMSFGIIPNSHTKIAILAPGNVSQGAFYASSLFGSDIRLYYRSTMNEFKENIGEYDIIINGIEISAKDDPIISLSLQKDIKNNALVIDAAADAGNAIEGTRFTTMDDPIYKENDIYFYLVNNAPSIYFKEASKAISKSFSKYVYKRDLREIVDLVSKIK